MKVYHQLGFRYNWNIDSLNNGVGDGVIFSPVNTVAVFLFSLIDAFAAHVLCAKSRKTKLTNKITQLRRITFFIFLSSLLIIPLQIPKIFNVCSLI